MGTRRLPLSAAVDQTKLVHGQFLARIYEDGVEKAKMPAGDGSDYILGAIQGVHYPSQRIYDGVVGVNGLTPPENKIKLAEKLLNFETLVDAAGTPANAMANDLIVIMAAFGNPDPAHADYWKTLVWDSTAPADGADPTFTLDATRTILTFHSDHQSKSVQVRYKPVLGDLEKPFSFDVGFEEGLNNRKVNVQKDTVDIMEPGDIFWTAHFNISATFKDGFAYARTDGYMGDDPGSSVKVARLIQGPTPKDARVKVEILQPKIHA